MFDHMERQFNQVMQNLEDIQLMGDFLALVAILFD